MSILYFQTIRAISGEKKYPTNSTEVGEATDYTLSVLAPFGDYEDAMSAQSKSLFHTKLSPLLNLHRVMPAEIADMALNSNSPLIRRGSVTATHMEGICTSHSRDYRWF